MIDFGIKEGNFFFDDWRDSAKSIILREIISFCFKVILLLCLIIN